MTDKLYEADGHIKEFSASVISCSEGERGFEVILDKTAFFPEGGGQKPDTGFIADAKVFDVQIKDGVISHFCDSPLEAGAVVECSIDWEQRFRRMQNHSGEHIVSGIIHKLYGFNNVGFHMGADDITIDIDGVLNREQLDEIELLANRAVCENVPVRAYYPETEDLPNIDYRSKLDLTENVRLVEIEGYDLCACCAPHVERTGEIGIIKLLDFINYKGGVRIHMLCGLDALADYNSKFKNNAEISNLLSAKKDETALAVSRLYDENSALKQQLSLMKKQLLQFKADAVTPVSGNLCIFEDDTDTNTLREYANELLKRCGRICAVFSGNDTDGYRYVILSKAVPLRALAKEINAAINGRGGGKDDMLQGSATASRAVIEEYFSAI